MKESLSLNQNRGKKLWWEAKQSPFKLAILATLQGLKKISIKEAHESFSSNSRGPIHEDRRLQIKELDEWRTHKPRTPDKSKLRQNEPDTSPNQLKVVDKVLLDAADPHIFTTTPNEEIPLTALSIFPFGTVKVFSQRHGQAHRRTKNLKPRAEIRAHGHVPWSCVPKSINRLHYSFSSLFKNPNPSCCKSTRPPCQARIRCHRGKKSDVLASKKRKGASSSSSPTVEICHPFLQFPNGPQEELFQILWTRPLTAGRCIDWLFSNKSSWLTRSRLFLPPTLGSYSSGLSSRHTSRSQWNYAQRLYTEEFREGNELHALSRHIHVSPSKCWNTLALNAASYNPSHSKASVLPPSLRYLHAILAHTITRRRESIGIVNTHDVYFLWCMSQGHIIDLAYFIALLIQYQTEQHQKGVISIGPYATRLVRHFVLFNTPAQESSLTLIDQMSPQGISRMLSMRMIKRRRGT
ncbi:hypothetical protein GOBAR_AA29282 [Gossypium barbadense]|uniref:Uncharacterized protein n=1 Tax=Gossypium barbadense TaxID=3634 RepID=A0A2P5WK11_GOSBA|nr:hypothetical protein GOBAR_AA29282 [Gossypium barbadense]